MKTIRTNFDRPETRRDRRYALPTIVVTLGTRDFATANWSLGGFLLADGPRYPVGETVSGWISLPGGTGPSHRFSAEVARRGADGIGFRFVERSMRLVGALDRLAVGRLARRRA